MPPVRPSLLATSLLLGLALAPTGRAADALGAPSPFLPPAAATDAAAPTQDAPLELRGIMSSGGTTMFSLYDPTHHSSAWVRQNDTGREFVVRNYDDARDVVTVEYQGRTLTLALKTAKVASAPVMPFPQPVMGPPAPAGVTPPQPIGGPVVLNPTPADEQRRLEAIAAEVNRRRMIRQQALQAQRQNAGQNQPGTPPPPQPR